MRAAHRFLSVLTLIVAALGACVGDDPGVSTDNNPDGGAPDGSSTTDSSSTDGDPANDASPDADLPPKAEGKFRWASAYGTGGQTDSVAFASADAVYMVTPVQNTVSFDGKNVTPNAGGPVPLDAELAKLDNLGKASWVAHLTGDNLDTAISVTADAQGNAYVVGRSYSSSIAIGTTTVTRTTGTQFGFAFKLDGATGTPLWGRRFQSSTTAGCNSASVSGDHLAIACGFDGASMSFSKVGGTTDTVANPGTTGNAGFVALLQASGGEVVWANALGTAATNDTRTTSVAVTSTGDVFASGFFTGASLVDTKGSAKLPLARAGTGFNGLVVRFSAGDGSVAWVKGFGDVANGAATVQAASLSYDATGGLAVVGQYTGTPNLGMPAPPPAAVGDDDGFVVSLDPNDGKTKWQKAFGGTLQERVMGVAVDRWGSVIVGGFYASAAVTIDGKLLPAPMGNTNNNAFLVKWANDGSQQWLKLFVPTTSASNSAARVSAVSTHASGEIVFGGGFLGEMDLGGGTATTAALASSFAVRVGP